MSGYDSADLKLSVKALTVLTQHAVKIRMHLDGTHGVYRQYCEPDKVLERARERQYILLDLGHVVRLYFGDDYFDLQLETTVRHAREAHLDQLVSDVLAENAINERQREFLAMN